MVFLLLYFLRLIYIQCINIFDLGFKTSLSNSFKNIGLFEHFLRGVFSAKTRIYLLLRPSARSLKKALFYIHRVIPEITFFHPLVFWPDSGIRRYTLGGITMYADLHVFGIPPQLVDDSFTDLDGNTYVIMNFGCKLDHGQSTIGYPYHEQIVVRRKHERVSMGTTANNCP